MGGGKKKKQQGRPYPKSSNYAPSITAVDPSGSILIVCVGSIIRGFDIRQSKILEFQDDTSPSGHGNAIRCVSFSPCGLFLATGGDDKLIKLWDSKTLQCIKTCRAPKKVSALAFSADSQWLTFADKYGVVFVVSTKIEVVDPKLEPQKQLLGHCCSIITGLAISPDNKYIASSDRDFKIRITQFPKEPLLGAHEIQSFCLGHTGYVTCISLIHLKEEGFPSSGFLISGAADGKLKIWDFGTGEELFSISALEEENEESLKVESTEEDKKIPSPKAITCLAVSLGGIVAISLECTNKVIFFQFFEKEKSLKHIQDLVLEESSGPSSLQFDSEERLWVLTGGGEAQETDDSFTSEESLRANAEKSREISKNVPVSLKIATRGSETHFKLLESEDVLGEIGAKHLQGPSVSSLSKVVSESTLLSQSASRKELSKREFSEEERETRKRTRADKR